MYLVEKTELQELIKGCKHQNRKSQNELVHRFAPVLMSVCKRYCKDQSLAKDALQETFLNVFSYIKGYSGKGSFEGWLRRIAVNCSLKAIKKIHPVIAIQGLETVVDISAEIPDVFSRMGKKELLKLIQQLPRVQYLVFNLNVIEGYRHTEIAQMLDITDSTSRANLSRARVNLIKIIREDHLVKLRRTI